MKDVVQNPRDKIAERDLDQYTPIKAVSTYNNDWIIKARVSKKFNVKTWKNARGEGKLLNIELVDVYGDQIQATFFNKACEKWESLIEESKVYLFSGG